jgi:hypothetical protein
VERKRCQSKRCCLDAAAAWSSIGCLPIPPCFLSVCCYSMSLTSRTACSCYVTCRASMLAVLTFVTCTELLRVWCRHARATVIAAQHRGTHEEACAQMLSADGSRHECRHRSSSAKRPGSSVIVVGSQASVARLVSVHRMGDNTKGSATKYRRVRRVSAVRTAAARLGPTAKGQQCMQPLP